MTNLKKFGWNYVSKLVEKKKKYINKVMLRNIIKIRYLKFGLWIFQAQKSKI